MCRSLCSTLSDSLTFFLLAFFLKKSLELLKSLKSHIYVSFFPPGSYKLKTFNLLLVWLGLGKR